MADPKSNKTALDTIARILRGADDITDAAEDTTAAATDLATCMALANALQDAYNASVFGYFNELLALLRTVPR